MVLESWAHCAIKSPFDLGLPGMVADLGNFIHVQVCFCGGKHGMGESTRLWTFKRVGRTPNPRFPCLEGNHGLWPF